MSRRAYPTEYYPSNAGTAPEASKKRKQTVGIPQGQTSRTPEKTAVPKPGNSVPTNRQLYREAAEARAGKSQSPVAKAPVRLADSTKIGQAQNGAAQLNRKTKQPIRQDTGQGGEYSGAAGQPHGNGAGAADIDAMKEIMGVSSYTGDPEDVARDFWRQNGVSSAAEYQQQYYAEQEKRKRQQEKNARLRRDLYSDPKAEAEVIGRSNYTGDPEDIAKEEWERYNVNNADDYRAAREEKGNGLDYLWRRAVGGAKNATQSAANDLSYRSQLNMAYQEAEQAYWEDVYNNGTESIAAREEGYADLTENQRVALEIMGGLDARSEYFLKKQQEAEEKYVDTPLVRAAYWGDDYNAETQQKYGEVSDALGRIGNFAEGMGSYIPALIVRQIPIFGPFLSNAMLYSQASGMAFDNALGSNATREEAELYASAMGTKAVLIERISDGMSGLFGKGTTDKSVQKLVESLGKTNAGKNVIRFLINANNEGLESAIDDVIDPLFATIYNGKQYSSAREYFSEVEVKQLLEDYLTAFGESLILQSGGELIEKPRKPKDPIYAVLLDQAQEKAEEVTGTDDYQRIIRGLNDDGDDISKSRTTDRNNNAEIRAAQAMASRNNNIRQLGIDPTFDKKVMTALTSNDIIDPVTGKYAIYGKYADLKDYKKQFGLAADVQVHHLNQQAIFGSTIPSRDGMCILTRGNVITESGSEHNLLHKGMEGFFDDYRKGGKLEGELPTVGRYTTENEKALKEAGYGDELTAAFIKVAVQELLQYGFSMDDFIPRIPGSMHLK